MNAVIYARFSSHKQHETSIEGQLKECYAYARRNGYTVIGEYKDSALSGTSDKRPEFRRMISDSSKKAFQLVIVYQLDRFARSRIDSATYKAILKRNGVRVVSARENITDDASGILMESVLEGFEHTNGHNKLKSELKQSIQCKVKVGTPYGIPTFY